MKSIHGLELFNFSLLINDGVNAVREIVKIYRNGLDCAYHEITDKVTIAERASTYRTSFKKHFGQNPRIIEDASDEMVFCAMDIPEKIRHDSRQDAQIGMLGVAFAIGTAPVLITSSPIVSGCLAVASLHKLFSARAKEKEAVETVERTGRRLRDAVIYGDGVTYNRGNGKIQLWG